jgi:hypothetical protein
MEKLDNDSYFLDYAATYILDHADKALSQDATRRKSNGQFELKDIPSNPLNTDERNAIA